MNKNNSSIERTEELKVLIDLYKHEDNMVWTKVKFIFFI